MAEKFVISKNRINFALEIKKNGTLTEWLGSGLQNRVQQFESAGYLKKLQSCDCSFFIFQPHDVIYFSIFVLL